MALPPRFVNPFAPLQLTSEDASQLEALAHAFVRNTMDQYERFAFDHRCEVDERRWKFVMERERVKAFAERREKDILAGSGNEGDDAPVLNAADLPVVLVTGTIEGTLDDAIYGYVSPTLDVMRIKTSYTEDQLVRCAVLATLVHPTPEDPFRSVTIKWFEKGRPLHVRAVVRNRDFVYMESTGMDMLSNGERIGYHLIHSVQFPQTPELDTSLRGNMSFSGVFRQKTDKTVEVYIKGVMNPAGGLMRSIIVKSASKGLVSSYRYVYCAEMKKLAWMLRKRTKAVGHSSSSSSSSSSGHDVLQDQVVSCASCGKKPSAFSLMSGSKVKSKCKICHQHVCSSCRLQKKLSFIAADLRLVQPEITFCAKCAIEAANASALQIAREELVAKEPFGWNAKYLSSSSSSELSPNSNAMYTDMY
uniref:FYVE-type domain-containing protein n=1 Tax=Globisporangium ultimum (strain ATCC 200006 / CBS 805.95 / DAOM BR144) TaxID=431595 RepID=K3W693_GLOUD